MSPVIYFTWLINESVITLKLSIWPSRKIVESNYLCIVIVMQLQFLRLVGKIAW